MKHARTGLLLALCVLSAAWGKAAAVKHLVSRGGVRIGKVDYIPSATRTDRALESALRQAFPSDHAMAYRYDLVDLSGDEVAEAITIIEDGAWCGTGGCTVGVFRKQGAEWRLMTTMPLCHTPIVISDHRSHGWFDLVIPVGGGGASPGYAVMQFDGKTYPENPTVAPMMKNGSVLRGPAILADPDDAPALKLSPR